MFTSTNETTSKSCKTRARIFFLKKDTESQLVVFHNSKIPALCAQFTLAFHFYQRIAILNNKNGFEGLLLCVFVFGQFIPALNEQLSIDSWVRLKSTAFGYMNSYSILNRVSMVFFSSTDRFAKHITQARNLCAYNYRKMPCRILFIIRSTFIRTVVSRAWMNLNAIRAHWSLSSANSSSLSLFLAWLALGSTLSARSCLIAPNGHQNMKLCQTSRLFRAYRADNIQSEWCKCYVRGDTCIQFCEFVCHRLRSLLNINLHLNGPRAKAIIDILPLASACTICHEQNKEKTVWKPFFTLSSIFMKQNKDLFLIVSSFFVVVSKIFSLVQQ